MSQEIKLIIFDMDGVLLDTKEMYIKANQEVFEEMGIKADREKVAELLGRVAENYFANFVPREKVALACELLHEKILTKEYQKQAKIIPGVVEGISQICHKKLAIVTNSVNSFAHYTLKKFNIFKYFSVIMAADSPYPKKTTRCRKIMRKFSARKDETILVGDLLSDYRTAESLGIKSCMVYNTYSWLYPDKEALRKSNPTYIIDNIKNLKKLLNISI